MARWFPISPREVSPLLLTAAVAVVVAGLAGGRAEAAAGGPYLAHQALYELKLVKSRGSNSISSARGRILYNFSGSACEGYTSEFRQVSELDSGEGKRTLSDLRSTSWEDGDGKSYRFKISTRMNDTDSSPVDGMAERSGDRITVKLKQPEAKTFTLDGSTVFPTEQITRIIAAAREGKSVLELTVYDGSDNGEKVYNTLSVIGQPIPGDRSIETPDPSTANDAMKSLTRWPVTVSYYDRDAKARDGEQTPVYAMSFELFENGVSRALVLDYNDFVISGALGKFDVRDSRPCK
ncbi:MAG: cell envelope integrity EipB family protein [Bradyrhizobium sp.]|uniref:cell envelope integrity EipB family protein n=1 Tax=Bradyrhizobium sp. TaxID=376 RepID=UPI0027292E77|nr:cell envelope integrity EipB family protein [Bradyrhizobium sp.]MDO9562506.1 cell envelope integrity EipB family protein [Bradyrhizobium sp.]MDP3691439.1 cell envelope integrity EipB family protein [Bradyrhizobium sp.]